MRCFLIPHSSEISLLFAEVLFVSVYQASRGHMCTQTDAFSKPLLEITTSQVLLLQKGKGPDHGTFRGRDHKAVLALDSFSSQRAPKTKAI